MAFSYYENAASPPVVNTPADFSKYFLGGLGVTNPSANQTQEIIDWAGAEGGNFKNTATGNELNTTLPLPGSHVLSGGGAAAAAGVQAYSSTAQGLDAQLSTILEPRYATLVADIRNNVPETQFSTDVAASPWGTGNFAPGSGGTGQTAGSFGAEPVLSVFGYHIPGTGSTGGNVGPDLTPGSIGNGILSAIEAVTAPLKSFVENSFLVVFGVIVIIIGLVLAARSAANAGSGGSGGRGGGGGAPASRDDDGSATDGTTTFSGGGLADAAAV